MAIYRHGINFTDIYSVILAGILTFSLPFCLVFYMPYILMFFLAPYLAIYLAGRGAQIVDELAIGFKSGGSSL